MTEDTETAERQIVRKSEYLDADFFNGTADEVAARIVALKEKFGSEIEIEGEEDWSGICVSAVYSRLETDEEMAARLKEDAAREKAARRNSLREAALARAIASMRPATKWGDV